MKIILAIAVLFSLACNRIVRDEEEVKQSIMDLIAADNRSDLESALSHYTNAATLVPPGKNNISGIENLRENYKTIFASTRLELSTIVEGVEVNRFSAIAWGYNNGKAISLKDSGVRIINDKYLAHLLKENGKWKIERLIWNSN